MKGIQTSESHNCHPVTLKLPVCSLYQRPPLVSLQCLCPVPHLAAQAQRAPVQVAPIAALCLRHHPRAAHSHLRMLQAQRQAVQPVHCGLLHPNCFRWNALSTACLRAQEIVKAIQWREAKWTTWETNSNVSPCWSKLPVSHRTNRGQSQCLQ